ncbi:collagen-binding protein [Draconibacterium sediminis]|uniref:Collagen-binding protein n=2 Tax=Draconibacterium sediminis TaxID=1544798 RepID=A0A0D8JCI3_9BACT|nr:collagen-binding protein [Draconibacterium sediminis]
MKRKDNLKFCIVMVLLFCSIITFAQQNAISGKVTDSSGEPLPGVTVVLRGTTQGTITDFDGAFNLTNVKAEDVLVFSFVGMIKQEVEVGDQRNFKVTMLADAIGIEEVVAVGYGTQVKREVSGSVQTVDAETLKDLPVSQVTQKIQGQMAGVQIKQTTGKPGEGMNVRIRGQFSIAAGSEPLYVVDGFPITGGINKINPDEIEDITVLKDAASTSLYGSRAANGVILITTKKGKPGQTNVSLNVSYGIQEVPERGRIDMMDAVEFAQFKKEFYEDAGKDVPEMFQNPSIYEGKNNDWYDALLQTAPVQSYNLTVTSNTDKLRTAAVAGFYKQDGVVINSDYERYSLRLNMDYDVSDKVTIGFNLAPSYIKDDTPRTDGGRNEGILFNALHTWPMMPIYDDNGELTLYNKLPADVGNIFSYPNWVRSAQELVNETKDLDLLSTGYLEYKPIAGLTLKSSINAQITNSKFKFFNPSTATYRINQGIPTTSRSTRDEFTNFSWLNENTATYTKSVGDHNFSLLGGATIQKFRQDRFQLNMDNFSDDRLPFVQTATNINRTGTQDIVNEWSLVSFLSRLTYNYKGKYLLTAAIRSDGSSRFGSENAWGTFPSVSVGWIASDESFMADAEAVSMLKLRASYGVTGNNNIGNYTQYALINNTTSAAFNDNFAAGSAVSSMANSNLGWETTKQFDIGFDLSLYNNRVSVVYDYYKKKTTNLLYNVQVPWESGFSNFSDNIGEIAFWGHELGIKSINTTGKLKWTTSANISFNRNEVKSLAEGIDRVYGDFHITKVGEPFGQFYGFKSDGLYMNQADLDNSPVVPGRSTVGSIKLVDVNNDGVITKGGDNDDRTIIGNPFPDFEYGMTNTLNYGNWDFSVLMTGSQGAEVMVRHLVTTANLDGVFNLVDDVKYRWRSEENPGKGFYGTTVGGGRVTGVERDWNNDREIADASYLNIRNITLGYTYNSKSKIFKSARFYASIQNVYIFTDYWGGPNPEISVGRSGSNDGGNLSQGVDWSGYPVPRIYNFGVNVNF